MFTLAIIVADKLIPNTVLHVWFTESKHSRQFRFLGITLITAITTHIELLLCSAACGRFGTRSTWANPQ